MGVWEWERIYFHTPLLPYPHTPTPPYPRMRYIPNTDKDRQEMLKKIGVQSVEELFSDIPESIRLKRKLNLPAALSEKELIEELKALSALNTPVEEYISFLGAGAYYHFIPSLINHLVSRSEFYTAYTPYQPEISQGTLQAIFEYQTLICQLTGMEVANASMYDGSTGLAEAVLMAHRINERPEVILSTGIHPEYRMVLKTYVKHFGITIREVGFTEKGTTDLEVCRSLTNPNTSAVVVQYPNFFGCIEDLARVSRMAKEAGALFIVVVTEPIALGILKAPGDFGADIVVGEGQSLGNPLNFGGPYVGFFAVRQEYLRKMPGRLAGETTDLEGKRGYVLTLSTREQHIRREKATSNICTNEALCALINTIYLCTLGKQGIRELAIQNLQKAHYARQTLGQLKGYKLLFDGPVFNEFVIQTPRPLPEINQILLENKIIGGLDLSRFYPELTNCMLVCVTENHSKGHIDNLVEVLKKLTLTP
ncbi:MAG TPA: aminomethyl-transferring glycine dehydrogenase subunit GcvPA [Candidatus Limnocylindrales bacterium]|nr:aminomethyl-transferring glycine dehydrogenase subunit GcvPA [Candidatus Limnocylindrales bacterium]